MTINRNTNIRYRHSNTASNIAFKKRANSILFELQDFTKFEIQQSTGNGLSITRANASMPDIYIANNGNIGIGATSASYKVIA